MLPDSIYFPPLCTPSQIDLFMLAKSQTILLLFITNLLLISHLYSRIPHSNQVSSPVISGTCWYDYGQDGIFDPIDKPMKAVLVFLLDEYEQILDSVLTNESGKYQFDGLKTHKSYMLHFIAGSDYYPSLKNASGYTHNDSDIFTNGFSEFFELSETESKKLDAGFIFKCSARTAGFKLDSLSTGCTGKQLKIIRLKLSEDPVVPDSYKLVFILTSGLPQKIVQISGTPVFQLSNSGIYNIYQLIYSDQSEDYNYFDLSFVELGKTTIVELSSAYIKRQCCASISSRPFGFFYNDCIQISGRLWLDQNKNAKQDPGEPDVKNYKVYLRNALNEILDSAFTNEQGRYLFDELNPLLKYKIQLTLKPQHQFTKPNASDSDLDDSDLDEQGFSEIIYLSPGSTSVIDAGFVKISNGIKSTEGESIVREKIVQNFNDNPYLFLQTNKSSETEINVQFYPNPFKDQVLIDIIKYHDYTPDISYGIYSLSGRVLQEGTLQSNPYFLDLNFLADGVYVFQWKTNQSIGIKKIVKTSLN